MGSLVATKYRLVNPGCLKSCIIQAINKAHSSKEENFKVFDISPLFKYKAHV